MVDSADKVASLWWLFLQDGHLDDGEKEILRAYPDACSEEIATKLSEKFDDVRSRFLRATNNPICQQKIGEYLCWKDFSKEVTSKALHQVLSDDCEGDESMKLIDLGEVFPTIPFILLPCLSIQIARVLRAILPWVWAYCSPGNAQFPQDEQSEAEQDNDKTPLSEWTEWSEWLMALWFFVAVLCRLLLWKWLRLQKMLEWISSVNRKCVDLIWPQWLKEMRVSYLLSFVSLGKGSKSRWKLYVSALRKASEKIQKDATVDETIQHSKTAVVAVLLSLGVGGLVSAWFGKLCFECFWYMFLAVVAVRLLLECKIGKSVLSKTLLDPSCFFDNFVSNRILVLQKMCCSDKEHLGLDRHLDPYSPLFVVAFVRRIVHFLWFYRGTYLTLVGMKFFNWLVSALEFKYWISSFWCWLATSNVISAAINPMDWMWTVKSLLGWEKERHCAALHQFPFYGWLPDSWDAFLHFVFVSFLSLGANHLLELWSNAMRPRHPLLYSGIRRTIHEFEGVDLWAPFEDGETETEERATMNTGPDLTHEKKRK